MGLSFGSADGGIPTPKRLGRMEGRSSLGSEPFSEREGLPAFLGSMQPVSPRIEAAEAWVWRQPDWQRVWPSNQLQGGGSSASDTFLPGQRRIPPIPGLWSALAAPKPPHKDLLVGLCWTLPFQPPWNAGQVTWLIPYGEDQGEDGNPGFYAEPGSLLLELGFVGLGFKGRMGPEIKGLPRAARKNLRKPGRTAHPEGWKRQISIPPSFPSWRAAQVRREVAQGGGF